MRLHRSKRWLFLPLLVPAFFFLTGSCSGVEDCGGAFGNKIDPRLRSSRVRMILEDPAAAYARFAPYAAMAALTYVEDATLCPPLKDVPEKEVLTRALEAHDWYRDDTVPGLPPCDDDVGTFFRVWTKERSDHVEVVMVFRGTRGARDWWLGNLRWATRFWPGEDQYERARTYARNVLAHYKTGKGRPPGKPVRFYSAGHSLGGGLAQNALYTFPADFVQAYAFDPSPVTGFKDGPVPDSGFRNETDKRRAGCDCSFASLDHEARVFRVYETDEILSRVRLPLKVLLPLGRQIQEIRLNTGAGHSIGSMASAALKIAGDRPLGERSQWWSGRPEAPKSCTDRFKEKLEESCELPYDGGNCPR